MSSYKAQLNAALKQRGIQGASYIPSSFIGSTGGGEGISFLKVGASLLSLIFIIFLILVVVHYTIRPIFKLKPADKGFIPLPGITQADDSEIYWEKLPHGDLDENDTIFGTGQRTISLLTTNPSNKNYSLCIDIYFNDLNAGANSNNIYRKVFCRYNPAASTNTENGLEWSVMMKLKPETNDLIVQVRSGDIDSVILTNVLPKTPMRIGLIVSDKYFEVYRDGKLVSTVILNTPPLSWTGAFWGDPGGEPTIYQNNVPVRVPSDASAFNQNPVAAANPVCPGAVAGPLGFVYNLHLWRREISPEEMRDSVPRLLKSEEFGTMTQVEQGTIVATNRMLSRIKKASQTLTNKTSTLLDTVGNRIGGAANALAGVEPDSY